MVLVLLALLEGLPSLLERQAWALLRQVALQELSSSVLVCLLEAKWLQSGVSSSRQESALGLAREQGGVPDLQGQGRRRVISPLPKIKGCTYVLVNKCNLLLSIARFPEGDPALLKDREEKRRWKSLQEI